MYSRRSTYKNKENKPRSKRFNNFIKKKKQKKVTKNKEATQILEISISINGFNVPSKRKNFRLPSQTQSNSLLYTGGFPKPKEFRMVEKKSWVNY